MNRDELLVSIRPKVETETEKTVSAEEAFQNATLRPILKLQHSLTGELLRSSVLFNKLTKGDLDQVAYTKLVTGYLQSDRAFRQLILGVIVGQFTGVELAEYHSNPSGYNKRILSMQIKRYVDTKYKEGYTLLEW